MSVLRHQARRVLANLRLDGGYGMLGATDTEFVKRHLPELRAAWMASDPDDDHEASDAIMAALSKLAGEPVPPEGVTVCQADATQVWVAKSRYNEISSQRILADNVDMVRYALARWDYEQLQHAVDDRQRKLDAVKDAEDAYKKASETLDRVFKETEEAREKALAKIRECAIATHKARKRGAL